MTPRDVWHLPHRHVGRVVHVYDAVGSTNDLAAALAADPANAGLAVLASVQTAGRGQHGRTWAAEPGRGVLLSVLLFPPPERFRPAVLTAWAAVGVAEIVRRFTAHEAHVKWPNDVLVGGHKVCGILLESLRTTQRPPHVVVGIGLNVNQTPDEFAAAGLPAATSLATIAGRAFDTTEVAAALLAELDGLNAAELPTLEARWATRLGLLGREVIVETNDGATHRGRLDALAFDGLRVGGTTFAPETVRHLKKQGSRGAGEQGRKMP